jgi:hypothetical protein
MKMYISGKISGLALNDVRKKFEATENMIANLGCEPVNPIKIAKFSNDKNWIDYMKECICALLDCEAILMQKDWGQSNGARIEYAIAKEIGLKIIFEE